MSQKSLAVLVLALAFAGGAVAQNVAIVNGKPVPKSRLDLLMQQAARRRTVKCRPSVAPAWPACRWLSSSTAMVSGPSTARRRASISAAVMPRRA